MKNNEEYLQAKEVIKKQKDYEQQMVYDSQNFIRGYEAALSIADVSNRRELLIAYHKWANCRDESGIPLDDGDIDNFISYL